MVLHVHSGVPKGLKDVCGGDWSVNGKDKGGSVLVAINRINIHYIRQGFTQCMACEETIGGEFKLYDMPCSE